MKLPNLLPKLVNRPSPQTRRPFHCRDLFLVSYPKSGNTWARFLMANLIKESAHEIDFHTVHTYIPEIALDQDNTTITEPSIFKSHAPFNPNYCRTIYIVRDGRDVYVSYYFYRLNELPLDTTFGQFLMRTDHWPCTWSQHVMSWLKSADRASNVLLVRYEDLLSNAAEQLARMAQFSGIDAPKERIAAAVQASDFRKMRQIEVEKGRLYSKKGEITPFTRKGTAGEWPAYFSPTEKDLFKKREGDALILLGYEPNDRW